jgi:hypothetical protein
MRGTRRLYASVEQVVPLQHEPLVEAGLQTLLSQVPDWQHEHWQSLQVQTPESQHPQHAQFVPHEQAAPDLALGIDANVPRLIKPRAATDRTETKNLFIRYPLNSKCEM